MNTCILSSSLKTLQFIANSSKLASTFLNILNLSSAEVVIGCPQDGASTTGISAPILKILMLKLRTAPQSTEHYYTLLINCGTVTAFTKGIPLRISHESISSVNQNSSKWFHLDPNLCIVHHNRPASLRDSS